MFVFGVTCFTVAFAGKNLPKRAPKHERLQGSSSSSSSSEDQAVTVDSTVAPDTAGPEGDTSVILREDEAPQLFMAGAGSTLSSSSRLEVAYLADCNLGSGYDTSTRLCTASALDYTMNVSPCDSGGSIFATCVKQKDNISNTYFTSTVSDQASRQAQTDVVTSASGAGYGVSASASASFTGEHMESGYSVSFFIGQMTDQYYQEIQAPGGLKLSPAAKQLLQANPEDFLNAYGKYFIQKVQYGAEFLGSVTLSRKQSSDSSALSVLASLSADSVYGVGVSADAEYGRTVTENRDSLTIRAQARYDGRTQSFNGELPQVMGEAFVSWRDTLVDQPEKNTVATRMVYRPWYELADVQNIINNMPQWIDAFNADPMNVEVQRLLTKEHMMNQADRNTLESISNWNCVSGSVADEIRQIRDRTVTHAAELDSLSDADFATRTAEVLNGHFDWFTAYEGQTLRDAEEALSRMTGCKQTATTGTTVLDWYGTSGVSFPKTCSNCVMTGLKFTTDKYNLVAMEALGNDIGLQVITEAQRSYTIGSSQTNPIHYGTGDHEIRCPGGSYITGVTVQWGGIVPLYHQRGAYDPKDMGAQPDLESCARAVRDGCSHDRIMWAPAASPGSSSWSCKCLGEGNSLYQNDYWNIYRVADVLYNVHGNMYSVHLHCKSLPPRAYGLPTMTTSSPQVNMVNRPDSTMSTDCPDGSVLTSMHVSTQSSSDHQIGPLVTGMDFTCRRLSDYW